MCVGICVAVCLWMCGLRCTAIDVLISVCVVGVYSVTLSCQGRSAVCRTSVCCRCVVCDTVMSRQVLHV